MPKFDKLLMVLALVLVLGGAALRIHWYWPGLGVELIGLGLAFWFLGRSLKAKRESR